MDSSEVQRKPVRLLSADVARKIAAGEVVDRPAALVRELIDNALDALSRNIEVQVEGGGARRTEVIDDGIGMTREDLALCWLPHATSKVTSLEDLLSAETLGFRGEALAAITAVAHVEILTSTDGREAWQLSVGPGGFDLAARGNNGQTGPAGPEGPERLISQGRRVRGTTVRVLGLFDSVPARKKFLKREGAEAQLCRQVFIDKAMAFPDRSFRFVQEGDLKLFFPPVPSYRERFIQALGKESEKSFIHEVYAQGEGFRITLVIGGPELYRSDRREQFVFANGRRIQDFALLQALEYGLQGAFPNGTHPVGALFIDIDPNLADFNIHPAKREVRFKDPGAIHHAITTSLSKFVHDLLIRDRDNRTWIDTTSQGESRTDLAETPASQGFNQKELDIPRTPTWEDRIGSGFPASVGNWTEVQPPRQRPSESGRLAMEALLEHPPQYKERPGTGRVEGVQREGTNHSAIYIGQLFCLFLLAEAKNGLLYIIDQHAAHERILYDNLQANRVKKQELLIPIPFDTDSEEKDRFLASHQEGLAELGIVLEAQGQGHWIISALPVTWKKGDADTVRDILELETAGEGFAERWLATMACHMAIKDGDYIDDITAQALIDAALALPVPRCPHGRPIWTTLSRDELFLAVRRTE
ncbi:MAG: DNA mismatch repair endonuclease MutL [Spirochaetota bacterium]